MSRESWFLLGACAGCMWAGGYFLMAVQRYWTWACLVHDIDKTWACSGMLLIARVWLLL